MLRRAALLCALLSLGACERHNPTLAAPQDASADFAAAAGSADLAAATAARDAAAPADLAVAAPPPVDDLALSAAPLDLAVADLAPPADLTRAADLTAPVAVADLARAPAGDLAAGGCTIGGASYAAGAVDPSDACQSCQPAVSADGWSALANGASCGSQLICVGGVCSDGCFIGGVHRSPGVVNPQNPCVVCDPARSSVAWSNAADGSPCGTNQLCLSGSCASGCTIDGAAYPTDALNPADPCQSCQPAVSRTLWTTRNEGDSCGVDAFCSIESQLLLDRCIVGCFIGGVVYPDGDGVGGCAVCDVSRSTTVAQPLPDGSACGLSLFVGVCIGQQCLAGCDIGGVFHADGASNPANSCQVCAMSTSGQPPSSAWSNVADGTACGNHQQCAAGQCH